MHANISDTLQQNIYITGLKPVVIVGENTEKDYIY